MSTREYGRYRDAYGNTWLGIPRPLRSMEVRGVYSTDLHLGKSAPYTHIVETYGPLRPEQCEGTPEDGGTVCIRPERHDSVCRSKPLD